MDVDLLVHSASQVLTLTGGPQRGGDLGNLGIIEDGAIAIGGDEIVAVGTSADLRNQVGGSDEIDVGGRVLMPGFVDPHTHLIWAGDRAAEFEARIAGATYQEIMEAGGGILSTVRETRAASVEDLVKTAGLRLRRMLQYGTTTAEAKTGYGLETDAELRMLDAILTLDRLYPVDIVPTLLAAHAIPAEFANDSDSYVDLILEETLPQAQSWWQSRTNERSLPFVDVFCETGAFNLEQSERILRKSKQLGFALKIHADEFDGLGGTGLAAQLGAASADHLVATPEEDIAALGASDTVAVSLPGTPFGLAEKRYTPASKFLEADAILALATDLNPGTSWCESMQFVLALACRYLGLTQAQAIAAATINAAAAVRMDDRVGSLEVGKFADLLILDVTDYRQLGYRYGTNLVDTVIKRGQIVSRSGVLNI